MEMKKSLWKEQFTQYDFTFEGRDAVVVLPDEANRSGKWLLKTEYFYAFQEMELHFVQRGYALAFVANRDRWGAQIDLEVKRRFCDFVIREFSLEQRCIPVGMSCGGLIGIKFAAKFPDYVSCLYLDAPVVNLLSCPCGLGAGTDIPRENIDVAMRELDMKDMSDMIAYRDHPLDNVPLLIQHRIPVAMCCGDSDTTVLYEENGLLVKQAYESSGVPFKFLLKKGLGHHPHGPDESHMDEFFRFMDRM